MVTYQITPCQWEGELELPEQIIQPFTLLRKGGGSLRGSQRLREELLFIGWWFFFFFFFFSLFPCCLRLSVSRIERLCIEVIKHTSGSGFGLIISLLRWAQ